MSNLLKVPCVWNGKPATKYIARAKITQADAWEDLDIPAGGQIVYIRLVNEEAAATILVCELEIVPDNNPPYYTIIAGVGEDKWWRYRQEGIPKYIKVRGGTIDNDYYYEYVILD